MKHLREQFLLDPEVIYLNHGSYGACPRAIFEAYQEWQLTLERNPVQFMQNVTAHLQDAREKLAEFVGTAANNLVFVQNATTGMNIIARSLALKPGDEILTTNHEYGAMDRTWRFVCEQTGAHYINHPVPLPIESAEQVVETIWAGVTERTRVLFLSHITSPTAIIFPIAPLIARAREAGILTVIDGAHAPGQIPLNLDALGADFYTGNCHKWLQSPKGSGFLYARPERQAMLKPLIVSWGWGNETPRITEFIDSQQYQGTRDAAGYLAVSAALDFFHTHNWCDVRDHCHALLRQFRQQIGALTGLPPIVPDSPDWYSQMATFALPPSDTSAIYNALREDYHIEVPVIRWQESAFIRVSVQGYVTWADLETLLTALERLLPAHQL